MKAKKTLICRLVFLKPPTSYNHELSIIARTTHLKIIEEKIAYILMSLFATKKPHSDKINV